MKKDMNILNRSWKGANRVNAATKKQKQRKKTCQTKKNRSRMWIHWDQMRALSFFGLIPSWKEPKTMHIEYFPAVVPIFMFDVRRQHVQQSGGKSNHGNKQRAKKKGNPERTRNSSNLKRSQTWTNMKKYHKDREATITRTPKVQRLWKTQRRNKKK